MERYDLVFGGRIRLVKEKMSRDLNGICQTLYETMEKGSYLILQYNSLPRNYQGCAFFPVETHTLQKIGRMEPVTTKQLADDLKKTPSAISQIVKKLKKHGVIDLKKNPQNNREVFISLNGIGRKVYLEHESLDQAMMAGFEEILEMFSAADLRKSIEIQKCLNKRFAENLDTLQRDQMDK